MRKRSRTKTIDRNKFLYFLRMFAITLIGYAIMAALIICAFMLVYSGIFDYDASEIAFLVAAGIVCALAVPSVSMLISTRQERKLVKEFGKALDKISAGDFSARVPLTKNNMSTDKIITKFNATIAELNSVAILRNDFIRNFSHEFKTPIASVKGFSELLYKNKNLSDGERERYCKIIYEESGRLANLAEMTLMLGRFDSQSIVVDREYIYLDEQLEECALQLFAEVEKKQLDVRINLQHVQVYASRELTKELWLNLFSNAVKYTGQGGHISVEYADVHNEHIISFKDDGIGIGDEAKAHIFDAYFQENTSRTGNGIGLGLSISKRIAELHGWKITFDSQKGKGSTFFVHIPK